MELKKTFLETGNIPTYDLEAEVLKMKQNYKNKPSYRVVKSRNGKKTLEALKKIHSQHNNSWYFELKKIYKDFPDTVALFYRGNKISAAKMFSKAEMFAKSLQKMGVRPHDKIAACLSNTPEFVELLIAVSICGAKINLFGDHYDKSFVSEILNECSDNVFFATDDVYENIKNQVDCRNFKNKVIFSLADSLKNPELCDEYEPELDKYYHFENKVSDFLNTDSSIMSADEFEKYGENYEDYYEYQGTLDDEFLTTYTSGSTKIGYPKPMVHTNRSLIVSGIFHSPELTGNPEINGLRGLAHIHCDSNTNVITCISDNLMQKWTVALEPVYGPETFLDVLFINKPNYCNATTSHILVAAKQYLLYKKHFDRKLPWLIGLFAVGEGVSKGEEKFINRFLKKAKAGSGVKFNGLSVPFVTLSIGGGDTEHGGIWYTLWKGLFEKIYSPFLKNGELGLKPVPYVHTTALKNVDGKWIECDYDEVGLLVSNSETTYKRYENLPEKTLDTIVTESNGRDWVSNNVSGYIDKLGTIHVKDRYGDCIKVTDRLSIENYAIRDIVLEDFKNVMTCVVTSIEVDGKNCPVINIEIQPYAKENMLTIITNLRERLLNNLPFDAASNCLVRIFDEYSNNHFPLTGSGKRSAALLENMSLDNTFRLFPKDFPYYTLKKHN